MKYISASGYQRFIGLCNKKGHKFKTNKFGVTWCVRCGAVGPWTIDDPITEDDRFIVVPDEDPRLSLIPGRVVGVDVDATIFQDEFPQCGDPVPGAIEVLKELQKYHQKILLHTMREHEPFGNCPDVLQVALDRLAAEGIEIYAVNEFPRVDNPYYPSRKTYADVYIDDHNVGIPLIDYVNSKGEHSPYVDWRAIDKWFVDNKYYPACVLEAGQ